MRYLTDQMYRDQSRLPGLTLRVHQDFVDAFAQLDLNGTIASMLSSASEKSTSVISLADITCLCKTNELRYVSKRIRAALGLRRSGCYEWAVAELHTALRMQASGHVPQVLAYGWRSTALGLPRQTFVVYEFLDQAVDLWTFFRAHPERIEEGLRLAFDTMLDALKSSMIHLDPWMGNFMVTEALDQCWMIDLEYSKMTSKAPFAKLLGFSLGYFYKLKFEEFMAIDAYFECVNDWLASQNLDCDRRVLDQQMHYCARHKLSRRQRLAML